MPLVGPFTTKAFQLLKYEAVRIKIEHAFGVPTHPPALFFF